MKNYRPVSNLPFLSTILEKVVLIQLGSHLTSNHLTLKFQSAYRASHSTETALLLIGSDSFTASDANQVSLLISLTCRLLLTPLTTPYCCAVLNNSLVFVVWPSAGSSRTCQTGFSLFLEAAVTPSYPNLIMRCHKGRC